MVTLQTLLVPATERLRSAGIPVDEARAEVRMLACHALGWTREQWVLRVQDPLSPEQLAAIDALISRRASREPLAYITGEREFYGLTFKVTPAVLIPRPETEHLVEAALRHIKGGPWHRLPQVADLGTGSGCIAIAIQHHCVEANVHATDLSEAALEVARFNNLRHGNGVTFFQGDLLAPLPPGLCFDVIVSNPPYIARTETPSLEPEVKDFEPSLALFDTQEDGLGFYRRLAREATARLVPGGRLLVEVGMGQAEAVAALWRQAGLGDVTIVPDYAGIGRVVMGQSGSCAPGR